MDCAKEHLIEQCKYYESDKSSQFLKRHVVLILFATFAIIFLHFALSILMENQTKTIITKKTKSKYLVDETLRITRNKEAFLMHLILSI